VFLLPQDLHGQVPDAAPFFDRRHRQVLQQPQFILNKFIALVKNFPDRKIQEILDLIYRLDYESKTSGEDSARISLQSFIFQVKLLK